MKTETELLKEAVINLTLRNSELQIELRETRERQDQYKQWWREDYDKAEKLEAELEELKSKSIVPPKGSVTVVEDQNNLE